MESIENVIVINIGWTKVPFEIDYSGEKSAWNPHDKGLYQVYGRHHAYGENALLYIGKSTGPFAWRVSGRYEFMESSAWPHTVRLGRILQPKEGTLHLDVSKWDAIIDVAERLLIRAHSPAMNKQGTTGLFGEHDFEGQHYVVLNWYDHGKLLPEVSTLRNSYRFWGFDREVGKMEE